MPLPQVFPPNPAPMRPDASMLPPGMQGTAYAQDRAAYQDQVSLQDLMQQMGAKQMMETQPGAIAAANAENEAKARYAVPDAAFKSEGLRLGNEKTTSDIATAKLQRQRDSLKYAQEQLDRAIEIGAVTSASPAGFAQFQQHLARAGIGGEIQDFFKGVSGPDDFQGRLNHLKAAREKTNIDWAKLLSNEKVASFNAQSTSRPGIWEQHVNNLTKDYVRKGMPEPEARILATREVMKFQAREGGLTQAPPEVQGQQALAKAIAEGRANIALLPDGPMKQRMIKHFDEMEKTLKGGAAPGEPAAGQIKPNAKPIAEAREILKRNNTPANRKFFKDTYGVEP